MVLKVIEKIAKFKKKLKLFLVPIDLFLPFWFLVCLSCEGDLNVSSSFELNFSNYYNTQKKRNKRERLNLTRSFYIHTGLLK